MTNSAVLDQLASSEKPTDLDLLCLQRQGISVFSKTRVNSREPDQPANPEKNYVRNERTRSSLDAFCIARDARFFHADNED